MELKNLSHQTQRAYLAAVTGFTKFYNQSPDKMTQEKIEDYLLYLKHDKGNAPNSCYSVLTGLRFFYKYVTEKEIDDSFGLFVQQFTRCLELPSHSILECSLCKLSSMIPDIDRP